MKCIEDTKVEIQRFTSGRLETEFDVRDRLIVLHFGNNYMQNREQIY